MIEYNLDWLKKKRFFRKSISLEVKGKEKNKIRGMEKLERRFNLEINIQMTKGGRPKNKNIYKTM